MSARISDFRAPLPRTLYWDASFLVHAVYPAGRYHRECYAFLERLSANASTLSHVSTLALDEMVFTLIQLKVLEDHPGQGFWEHYRRDPHVIQPYLGEIRTVVDRLAADPRIQLVGTACEDLPVMLDYMGRYACLPRDALHLAVMRRFAMDGIVTTDRDFVSVDGLDLFTCNPQILQQK